ncbi:hypothetical protein HOI26_04000 [Candidatus Woesearchaeota archaeon]|jgi:hypothetical protein|nr:hypothetical protein [Candidatus Woesearchaeota archaeon]MBT5740239.1 hypothetical protein [Candidatus Woesearchaeota archaeon]
MQKNRPKNNSRFIKPLLFGALGSLILFSIYLGILTWANSIEHAWQQFVLLWPWMSALIIGFGVQVSMFTYMHQYKKSVLSATGTTTVVATGGVSAGSMVACCLHHVVDVLPIIGLSAAAVFLSKYQSFFLELGIVSNLIGITFMLYTMQKHNLFFKGGFLEKLMKFNLKKLFIITLLVGIFVLLIQLGVILWR